MTYGDAREHFFFKCHVSCPVPNIPILLEVTRRGLKLPLLFDVLELRRILPYGEET